MGLRDKIIRGASDIGRTPNIILSDVTKISSDGMFFLSDGIFFLSDETNVTPGVIIFFVSSFPQPASA